MLFSWDDHKNRINQRKHGLSFETAKHVFDDPLHISRQDRIEAEEPRWQTIGMINGVMLLLVAHTVIDAEQGEHIRIISARLASRQEKYIYEQDNI